jgi:PKD domain
VKIAHAVGESPTMSTFIAASSKLNFPAGLTWHGANFYVVDLGATSNQGQVLRYSATGQFLSVFAHPPSALDFQFPSDAVFNGAGNLLTADLGSAYPPNLEGSIAMFNASGTFVRAFAATTEFAITGQGTSGFAPSQLTLNAGDRAPTVNAGTAYTINEGSALTVQAHAADPEGHALTYSWDINGDGTFGDATGPHPTLSWAQLEALGISHDGKWTMEVMVSDGHGQVVTSAPVTLTVEYVPPTIKITGPTAFHVGQTYTLDLSDKQIGTGHNVITWTINWGDGSAPQQVPGTDTSVTHVFSTHAHATITATATNDVGTYDSNVLHVVG